MSDRAGEVPGRQRDKPPRTASDPGPIGLPTRWRDSSRPASRDTRFGRLHASHLRLEQVPCRLTGGTQVPVDQRQRDVAGADEVPDVLPVVVDRRREGEDVRVGVRRREARDTSPADDGSGIHSAIPVASRSPGRTHSSPVLAQLDVDGDEGDRDDHELEHRPGPARPSDRGERVASSVSAPRPNVALMWHDQRRLPCPGCISWMHRAGSAAFGRRPCG